MSIRENSRLVHRLGRLGRIGGRRSGFLNRPPKSRTELTLAELRVRRRELIQMEKEWHV